jgi:protein-tyrosine-phosphatase
MPSVLFVCTGNQYRSPIAAAFFSRQLQEHGRRGKWRIGSAGTWTVPKQPLPADAVRDAISIGVDIQGHLTKTVNESMLKVYDLILAMEKGQKEAMCVEFPFAQDRIHLLSEMQEGIPYDVPDPLQSPGEHYLILREMCDLIQRGYPRITMLAEHLSRRQS